MIVHSVQQQSVDWFNMRAGIPTASEFDNLVTGDFKIRTGEMPKTYLAQKVAQWWIGGPLPQFTAFNMEQGNILEEYALPWYELTYDQPINRVGFITTDDGRIGCSPDGLLGEHSGIEIKCPAIHTHVSYLLAGVLPKDYAAQVHGSMFVTGRPTWKFLSYSRRFPKLLLTVEADAGIQGSLQDALDNFLDRFEAAKKQMIEINGGPPKRPVPGLREQPEQEPDDVAH